MDARTATRSAGCILLALASAVAPPCLARTAPLDDALDPLVVSAWQVDGTADGLPDDDILCLRVIDDEIWVGTSGGLARRTNGGWQCWTSAEGLPWPAITDIALDSRTGDLWLGTWGGGLIRSSGGRFDQLSQLNSGLAGNLVFAVAVEGDLIWAATNGGLSAFDTNDGTWHLYLERRADTPETAILGLARNGDDLYASAWCEDLRRFDRAEDTWRPLGPPSGHTMLSAAIDADSFWWVATDGRLWRDVAGQRQSRTLPLPEHLDGSIPCLTALGDTAALVGADGVLTVLLDWRTDTWITYRAATEASAARVTLRSNGRTRGTRTSASSLPRAPITCLASHHDAIWVGTSRGLARGVPRARWSSLPPGPPDAARRPTRRLDTSPGRAPDDHAIPAEHSVVQIGVLRPGNRTITIPGTRAPGVPRLGHMDRMAVNLAIEHANAAGGFRGVIPFGTTTGPSGTFRGWGWTTPEDDLPALAARPDVFGMVGYLGPETRLTSASLLRSGLPLVNAAQTPASADEVFNPWIFRCHRDDVRRSRVVLDAIFEHLGLARVALLRAGASRHADPLEWWTRQATDSGRVVVANERFDPTTDQLAAVLRAIDESEAEVVCTWADPDWSATVLRAMRRAGMTQLFVGGPRIVTPEFVGMVGVEPGLVLAVAPDRGPMDPRAAARFEAAYRARYKRPPAPNAHALYESATHLIAAINRAGLDRQAIRATLAQMRLDGRGEGHGDASGPEAPTPVIARLEHQRWTVAPPEDLLPGHDADASGQAPRPAGAAGR